jgi:hypothetical protein
VAHDLLSVDRRRRNHAVRAGHRPSLNLETHFLLAFGRRFSDAILQLGQSVKHADQRHAPMVGKQQT